MTWGVISSSTFGAASPDADTIGYDEAIEAYFYTALTESAIPGYAEDENIGEHITVGNDLRGSIAKQLGQRQRSQEYWRGVF